MFDPTRERSKGYAKYALGAAAGLFALGACDDPVQNTDLRPEGPPDVLTVLVMTDAVSQLAESATYCKTGDDKRPTTVGLPDFTLSSICDEDSTKPASMVTNAYPDGWYVRIMFDELLDPDVEELIEITDPDTGMGTDTYTGSLANTQPVILECESVNGGFVNVPYDGYYSPAGNSVTWPLGPALVIKPDDPTTIATNKMCRVTIKDSVTDKSGNQVPADQRGPFAFKIAPITPIAIDPADGSEVDALQIYFDNFYVQFNTYVDEASFCDEGPGMDQCEFSITPETEGYCSTGGESCIIGGPACPTAGDVCEHAGYYAYSLAPFGFTETEFGFGPNAPLQVEKDYSFQFLAGTKVKDRCGVETTFGTPSVADNTLVSFTTNPFDLNTLTPGNGDTTSSLRKPTLTFSNVLDPSTLDAAEYSITPAPANPVITSTPGSGGDFIFGGHYQPSTMYTFTLNAGATVTDAYGVTFTNAAAKTVTYTTQAIAVTSTSPANRGSIAKATPTSTTRLSISFNQSMDATTLLPTEYTLTGPMGDVAVSFTSESGCAATSTSCSIRVTPGTSVTPVSLPPGDYTFTLKAGATINDKLGNVYTQAADRVVEFTIENATATPVVCL